MTSYKNLKIKHSEISNVVENILLTKPEIKSIGDYAFQINFTKDNPHQSCFTSIHHFDHISDEDLPEVLYNMIDLIIETIKEFGPESYEDDILLLKEFGYDVTNFSKVE